MIDFLILLFGINGVEALLIVLFFNNFYFKSNEVDMFLSWIGITFLNYIITKYISIPIPLVNQILLVSLTSSVLSKIMDVGYLKSFLKVFISIFGIFAFTEIGSAMIYSSIFNIDLANNNIFNLFLLFIPIRIIQFSVSYFIVRCFYAEDVVWFNRKKRERS